MSFSNAGRSSNSSNYSGRSPLPRDDGANGADRSNRSNRSNRADPANESDDDILVSTASSSSSVSEETEIVNDPGLGRITRKTRVASRVAPSMKTRASTDFSEALPHDVLNYMYVHYVHVKGISYAASWLRSMACLSCHLRDWAHKKLNENREVGYSSTWRSVPEIVRRSDHSRAKTRQLATDLVANNAYVHADFKGSSMIPHADAMLSALLCGPAGAELKLDMSRQYQATLTDVFINLKELDNARIKALRKGFRSALKQKKNIEVTLRLSVAGRNLCKPTIFQEMAKKNLCTMQEINVSRIDMKILKGVTAIYTPPRKIAPSEIKRADDIFSSLFSLAKQSLDQGNLRHLNFSATGLTGENLQQGVKHYLLDARHALDSLDLSENSLGKQRPRLLNRHLLENLVPARVLSADSGVGAIDLLLQSKNCPATISLRYCYLTDDDADLILKTLQATQSSDQAPLRLLSLHLEGNRISAHHPIWADPRVKK